MQFVLSIVVSISVVPTGYLPNGRNNKGGLHDNRNYMRTKNFFKLAKTLFRAI